MFFLFLTINCIPNKLAHKNVSEGPKKSSKHSVVKIHIDVDMLFKFLSFFRMAPCFSGQPFDVVPHHGKDMVYRKERVITCSLKFSLS